MKYSGALLREARKLREQGNGRGRPMPWNKVAEMVGAHGFRLRLALDPGCVRQSREETEILENMRKLNLRDHYSYVPRNVLTEREKVIRASQSLTAILMGDPLPGRSALDRKGA